MAKVGRMVKEAMVEELSARRAERLNLLVTRVKPLSTPEADALRQKVHASQAEFMIVKRRLGQRACQGLQAKGIVELLEGSVGLVLSQGDFLPAAKLIIDFIKSHEDQLAVRGAVLDGQLLDRGSVEELASLPPKPILLAQVVLTIESPLAGLIDTIERLVGDVAWVAEQAAAKKSQAPEPSAEVRAAPEPPAGEPPSAKPSAGDASPSPESRQSQPPQEPPGESPTAPDAS